jgi:hypothetical protein
MMMEMLARVNQKINKKIGNDKRQRQTAVVVPTSTTRNNTTSSRHKSQQKKRRRRGGDGVQRIPTPNLGWPFDTTTTTTTTKTAASRSRPFFSSQQLSQGSGFSAEFHDRKNKAADAPLTFSQSMDHANELNSRHGPPSSPLPDEGVSSLRKCKKLGKKVMDIDVRPKPQSMSLSTAYSASVVLPLPYKHTKKSAAASSASKKGGNAAASSKTETHARTHSFWSLRPAERDAVMRSMDHDPLGVMQQYPTSAVVQERGCTILLNQTHQFSHTIALAGYGSFYIPTILQAMRNHPSVTKLQHTALEVIRNLCVHDSNRLSLWQSGGIRLVVDMMQTLVYDAEIQRSGCNVLASVAQGGMQFKIDVAKCGGILAVMKAVERHPDNDDVLRAAQQTLGVLGYNPDGAS